ncbi:protein neuralized-like [Anneissia japonica]|uniref:protein neuralized-like n=1 Tax=Anneissia japonica TaxID=1529436 RepID=UPI0014257D18|nr:protein neuralized-like [Anneissia japonica]
MGQNPSTYSRNDDGLDGGYGSGGGSMTTSGRGGQPNQRHSWTSSKYNSPHIPVVSARTGGDGNDNAPLGFHHVHGKHIQLSENGKLASRVGSFCNAIVFTSRPIAINEEVNMELVHSTSSWSGVLRFGFTQQNPARIALGGLPRYACPDLTVKLGYWAKALRENYAGNGNLLTFYCNEYGEVYFKMDNATYQLFFSDVDISSPLWALVDVYGNTTGVRLKESSPAIPRAIANSLPASRTTPPSHSAVDESSIPNATTQNTANTLPTQNYDTLDLERVHFHEVHGHSVRLRSHKKQAKRKTDSYQGGIVFSHRPLRIGEEIVIKVIEVSSKFVGQLGFGVTSCDPNILNLNDIPDDVEALYDRPEFWAFSRDFPIPEERDTISFMIDDEGKVLCRIHGQLHGTLMHVDISQPLWAAFDIYGNTQVIRLLGIKRHSIIPPSLPLEDEIPQPPVGNDSDFLGMRELVENLYVHLDGTNITPEVLSAPEVPALPATKQEQHSAAAPVQKKANPPKPSKKSVDDGECTVCFEKSVNAVFYKCGHMCTCFECGKKLRLAGSPCPICRAYIMDVIKTFKS